MATLMSPPRPGPTGRHIEPPIRPDDKGELRAACFIRGAYIILDFGTSLSWLGMSADDAERVGRELLTKAAQLRERVS